MRSRKIRRNKEIDENDKIKKFLKDMHGSIDYSKPVNMTCFIKHETGEVSTITTSGDPVDIIGLERMTRKVVIT